MTSVLTAARMHSYHVLNWLHKFTLLRLSASEVMTLGPA